MSLKDRAKFILRSYWNSASDSGSRAGSRSGSDESLFDRMRSSVEGIFDGADASGRDPDEIDLDDLESYQQELDRQFREEFADIDRELRRHARGEGRRPTGSQARSRSRRRTQALAVHYEVLGLKPGTPYDKVRVQFRRLMKKYHPDRFASDPKKQAWATKKSQAISESFDVLERALKKP